MKLHIPRRPGLASFTLIELLVAIAILATIVILLGAILASTSAVSISGQQDAENSSNARTLLDLMSRELQSGVNRADLTNWVTVTGQGSTLMLYSRCLGSSLPSAPPPSSYRGLSYIQYQWNQTATHSSLNRGDQAILWTDPPSVSTGVPLGFSSPTAPSPQLNDVLDGVVAFQVTFLQKDGTYTYIYSATDTIAAVLSIALVDSKSFTILVGTGKLQPLSAALTSASNGNTSPMAAWQNAIDVSNALAGYPQAVKTGLRFFERTVYLPPPAL